MHYVPKLRATREMIVLIFLASSEVQQWQL